MSRPFLAAVIGLSVSGGALLGLVVAGSLTPTPALSATPRLAPSRAVNQSWAAPAVASFADIAERLNPAVVNIDATYQGTARPRRRFGPQLPEGIERPYDRERDGLRRGAGTGFLIDANGHILTTQHVVDTADRLTVRLSDGRSFRAERIGSDPETDIALLKVASDGPLPFAPLGDSDRLRVGEWVVAIGNPLAYEHTVTVGVVSFIGRKLFNTSLDRYIQTDAAINFGNSGGPLINTRGEVVGINWAISSRSPSIGFAVPIKQATLVLPQLIETGRVARGYIGIGLRDVDADLQRSLHLRTAGGALVQDVTAGSPGARAGLRIYDLIVALDGRPVISGEQLIQLIAQLQPGTLARLHVLRDDRAITIPVKLAERPLPDGFDRSAESEDGARPARGAGSLLGLSVREMDPEFSRRAQLPDDVQGLIVSRVEPTGPAFEADIERGHVVLEINRQPVRTLSDYQRITAEARPGDVLAIQVYKPELTQRALHTVKIDP